MTKYKPPRLDADIGLAKVLESAWGVALDLANKKDPVQMHRVIRVLKRVGTHDHVIADNPAVKTLFVKWVDVLERMTVTVELAPVSLELLAAQAIEGRRRLDELYDALDAAYKPRRKTAERIHY